MENSENISPNYSDDYSKEETKIMRKTKYFREPLFSKMMAAIRKVRGTSGKHRVKEVAEETGIPCRTLRRYVELSMDDDIVSPFYHPLACNEKPIGWKFRNKYKNQRIQSKHGKQTTQSKSQKETRPSNCKNKRSQSKEESHVLAWSMGKGTAPAASHTAVITLQAEQMSKQTTPVHRWVAVIRWFIGLVLLHPNSAHGKQINLYFTCIIYPLC